MNTTIPMRPSTSGTTASSQTKKKGSLRSLFSIFRRTNSSKSDLNTYPHHDQNSAASSVSNTYLPPEVQLPAVNTEDGSGAASLSTEVTSPFSRSPSSSSASTLSTENGSDVSTPNTTPSNSSPCILIKASEGSGEPASQEPANKGKQLSSEPLFRRNSSATSSVTDTSKALYLSPTFPDPADGTGDSQHMKSKKRRSAIGRMLLRRTRSTPDFNSPTDAEEAPPLSRIGPQERSVSIANTGLTHTGLTRRLSRRGSTKGIPGLDKDLVPDPIRTREEHLSILGADPMGSSFYLYPTSKQEVISRRKSARDPSSSMLHPNRYRVNSEDKRRSWSGLPSDLSLPVSSRRPRSVMRPSGSFQPSVANQVIIEEGTEFGDEPISIPISRRHSTHHGQYDNWRPPRFDNNSRPGACQDRPESHLASSTSTPTISVTAV